MRRLYIVIAAAAGLYLDSMFFARVNISGIRPDAIMALTASLGVLLGMKKGALFGLIMGLIADVLYSPMVGLSAMGYMFAGLLGGAFYQKYYADNIIIPALVAAVGAIFKECVMAAACAAGGAKFGFFTVLGTYILPCALLSAAVCMLTHALMRRALAGQLKVEHTYERDSHAQGGVK